MMSSSSTTRLVFQPHEVWVDHRPLTQQLVVLAQRTLDVRRARLGKTSMHHHFRIAALTLALKWLVTAPSRSCELDRPHVHVVAPMATRRRGHCCCQQRARQEGAHRTLPRKEAGLAGPRTAYSGIGRNTYAATTSVNSSVMARQPTHLARARPCCDSRGSTPRQARG